MFSLLACDFIRAQTKKSYIIVLTLNLELPAKYEGQKKTMLRG